MTDRFHVTGKVVLVTGASRGLGRAMALGFAEAGADVAIVSRRIEACEAVATELEALGHSAFPYACHVGHWDELDGLVEAVIERFGKIDVLVNNAGISPLYPALDQVSEELFDKVIGVNLKGPFRLSSLVGKHMAEGAGGSIINISSIAAISPSPNAEPYGASKAGINSFTRSMASAFGPSVRVNSILAGPFLTDMWDPDAFEERGKTSVALRRGGQPDEIVGTALYLASSAASFTTGSVLTVDGGSL